MIRATEGAGRIWSDVALPAEEGRAGHPFVVLEGLDGAGKSTVAAAVAAMLGGSAVQTPPEMMRSILRQVDAEADPQTRLLYLLAGVSLTSQIVLRQRADRPVVCDRYLYSALAYAAALDGPPLPPIGRLRLATPDLIVFLEAPRDVREARAAGRARPLRDVGMDVELRRPEIVRRVEALFAGFRDLVIIPTAGVSADVIAGEVLARLRAGS